MPGTGCVHFLLAYSTRPKLREKMLAALCIGSTGRAQADRMSANHPKSDVGRTRHLSRKLPVCFAVDLSKSGLSANDNKLILGIHHVPTVPVDRKPSYSFEPAALDALLPSALELSWFLIWSNAADCPNINRQHRVGSVRYELGVRFVDRRGKLPRRYGRAGNRRPSERGYKQHDSDKGDDSHPLNTAPQVNSSQRRLSTPNKT